MFRSIARCSLVALAFILGDVSQVEAQDAAAAAQQVTQDLLGRVVDLGAGHADVVSAVEQFLKGDVEAARTQMAAAAKAHPEMPPAETVMARLFFRGQSVAGGRNALERAVVDSPQDPEPYIMMAELDIAGQQYTSAEALLAKAAGLARDYSGNPKRAADFRLRVYGGLATIAEGREQWPEAASYHQSWLKIADESGVNLGIEAKDKAAIQYRSGRALFKAGKFSEAEAALTEARAGDAGFPLPQIAMGGLYQEAGDAASAQQSFNAAAASADDLKSHLTLAQWYLEQGEAETAKKHADAAGQKDPEALEAMVLRGVIARIRNDRRTAISWFERAHLAAPNNFTVMNQLALALADEPDEESKNRALQFADMNQKLNPKNPDAASTLGWVHYRAGNTAQALRILNEAQTSIGLSSDGNFYVAKMYDNDRKFDKAREYLERASQGKMSYPVRIQAAELARSLNVSLE